MTYNRREFLKVSSSASVGLMIGVALPYKERLIAAGIIRDSFEPNVWIKILPNNKINIVTAKSEMGQHIRTSIPMIIAEELEAEEGIERAKQIIQDIRNRNWVDMGNPKLYGEFAFRALCGEGLLG